MFNFNTDHFKNNFFIIFLFFKIISCSLVKALINILYIVTKVCFLHYNKHIYYNVKI